jgi:hypothetical protein
MWKSMQDISLDDNADDWQHVDQGYNGPPTPSTISDNADHDTDTRPQQYQNDTSDAGSDDEYGGVAKAVPRRQRGGYDSRIEQILYENPELPILIVDAGKSSESGGKYIVYTIRTGVMLQDSVLQLCTDHPIRTLKSVEDTPNLLPSEMPSRDYILP